MNILITGATGFVGKALCEKLLTLGYQLTALTRRPAQVYLPESIARIDNLNSYQNLNEFDAVINLAGEPIFQRRWTASQKVKLEKSRLELTALLVKLINQSEQPPTCFISGSASGFYGDCGERLLDEQQPAGSDFAAQLCQQWEQIALQAHTRVCLLRTAMVMDKSGGALAKMLPLYGCGLGGKLASGQQFWSWISLPDMVNGIIFLLQHPQCQGAFNLASPTPIRNSEFNRLLAQQLNRPHFATAPAFALKMLLGERASLLLNSQRLVPTALLAQGFTFQDETSQHMLARLYPE